jgi:hypothetical protein
VLRFRARCAQNAVAPHRVGAYYSEH